MKTVSNFVSSESQDFPASVRAFLPQYALVAMNQIQDKGAECIVSQGEVVKEGQLLCRGEKTQSNVHSPVPGTITAIEQCSLPNGRVGKALRIKTAGSFSFLGKKEDEKKWESLDKDELCRLFVEKGVINTFSKTHSLADEIDSIKIKRNRFVVVRLFDEDPSRMTDSFIAETRLREVTIGSRIIAKAFDAIGIIFVVPKKKNLAPDTNLLTGIPSCIVETDTSRYPVGFTHPIINAVKKAAVTPELEFFSKVNHKSLFIDPETALSAYEAVVLGQPVVERYVHITGDCLRSAAMFRVRIGTTVGSLAEQCGGFAKTPAKIIINGLVTGCAISTLETPITKYVKSVSFIPFSQVHNQQTSNCVRCGRCRAICPEGLLPDLLFRHQTGGKSVGTDLVFTANLCTNCNLCNSACPSRLPLSQVISLLRTDNKNE